MGQWKDGNKDGEGTLQYANGDRYEGMWRKDAAHGRGTLQYTTGDVYEGDWKDNLRHGSGTFTCAADGKVYAGEFADGLKHGRGTLTLPSGDSITGNWDRGHVSGGVGPRMRSTRRGGILSCSPVLFVLPESRRRRAVGSQCDSTPPQRHRRDDPDYARRSGDHRIIAR